MGLDWNSSSSPFMCCISMIWTIAQGSLHSGSLRNSFFSAPTFHLLYLLPLCSSLKSSSSSGITSLVLCILSPSLPSSSLSSFSPILILSSCHPPIPLCAWSPLSSQTPLSPCICHTTPSLSMYLTISWTFRADLWRSPFLQHWMTGYNLQQIL